MQLFNLSGDAGPDDSWCRKLGNFPSPGWVQPLAARGPAASVTTVRAAGMRDTHRLRAQFLQAAFGVATAAALMVSPAGSAQAASGGGRGGHGHSGQDRNAVLEQADP